jgi:protein ImuB
MFIPQFPLAACLRDHPALAGQPVALLDTSGPAARILCVTPPARKEGIVPGLSASQARLLLPGATVKQRDPEAERTAREIQLQVAEDFSPRVEEGDPGMVYLDLAGVRDEPALAEAIRARAAAAGLPARVGVAGSRLAARIAAQRTDEISIVPPGSELASLSPLPIFWLNPPSPLAETLKRWGIRSIGAFAALPEGEVATRLGKTGRQLHRAIRGIDEIPLMARRKPPVFSEEAKLDWPICEIDPLLFLMQEMLARLGDQLASWGVACSRLQVTLQLDPKGEERRTLQIAAPTSEIKTLLELLRLELTSRPPGAPIIGVTLQLHPGMTRQIQTSLFGPPVQASDQLATTIARLSSLLGAGRIGSPKTQEGTLPERFGIVPYAPPPPPKMPPAPAALFERAAALMAVRVIRPAVELEVITGEPAAAKPLSLRALKNIGSKNAGASITGKVKVASGPWRMEEGWWTEERAARDYWDIELADGRLYRIFHDLLRRQWFADGLYD